MGDQGQRVSAGVGAGFEAVDPRIKFYIRTEPQQNFGDYLPPLLAKHLLQGARVEADIYRLIGSVIAPAWIRKDLRHSIGIESGLIAYWGCGLREPVALPPEVKRNCVFYGARGPLTRDHLGLPAETPLGDPGLLLPLFVRPSGVGPTVGKTICIAHVHDPADRGDLLARSGCDLLVSPTVEPTEQHLLALIDQIANAEFVLTGSLHGAITACAFGVPFAFWDTGFVDAVFKWRDFAASIGVGAVFAQDLAQGRRLYETEIGPAIDRPSLAEILRVAPFTPKPSAILGALRHDGRLSPDGDALRALAEFDAQSDRLVQTQAAVSRNRIEIWSKPSVQAQIAAGRLREMCKKPLKRLLQAS